MSRIGEAVLRMLSRDPEAGDYLSARYVEEHSEPSLFLETLVGVLPNVTDVMQGARALSVGCSEGMEVLAMSMLGASEAHGIDVRIPWEQHRALARDYPEHPMHLGVMDGAAMAYPDDSFDVVVTCRSFEHFADPYAVLLEMKRVVRPGGHVFITSSVWSCPWGAHMSYFTKVPWVQFLFSEETIMAVRSDYRDDGARCYAECGINDVGIRSFRRMVRRSGMEVRDFYLRPVKGLATLTRIPLVNEFFTNLIAAELRKSNAKGTSG